MKRLKFLATCHRRTGFLLILGALATQLHAASGDADLSLDAGSGVNGEVTRMALQPDGKLIVAGSFTTVRGLSRVNLARLNPDGSGDAAFDAEINADRFISAIAVQSDRKVIFTRGYANFNGDTLGKVARLNTNGALDTSFAPTLGTFPAASGIKSPLYLHFYVCPLKSMERVKGIEPS